MDEEQQPLKTHQPCPDCGSSDALAIYPDHTYCYSCNTSRKTDGEDGDDTERAPVNREFLHVRYQAIASRKLTEETCRFWSYGVADWHGKQVQVAQYLNNDRRVTAQKIRTRDKEFPWIKRSGTSLLFGQWLWRDGGKMVVITEGEIDAMVVSQVQNHKWPVVSLPDGAGKKALKYIKANLAWLNKFEKIVLFFDNDDAGRETVDLVRKVLPPGKCFITYTPEGYKDACDLLVSGKGHKIMDCVWGAKQYRPDGLVSGTSIIDRLKNRPVVTSFSYPEFMSDLNYMTGNGIRLGELDVWTSGTGMGKTTVIKCLQNHFFHTTEMNQALVHLEEPLEDTGDDLIAYELGYRFQIDDQEFRNSPEYMEAARKLFEAKDAGGHNRFQLYDAFGSLEDDSLYEIIRYAAVAMNCKVIWLDHLSILVSDMDADTDERRKIDSIMHRLKELTVELNIYIGLISHLRKPAGNGKSFEEGGVPTLDDLRGSGGIKQLANGVLAISRNQQAENLIERQTSQLHVLKCRKTGRTGPADFVKFDDASGRITKGTPPDALGEFDTESEESSDY